MNEPSTTGRCLCGAVRFHLAQPAKMATYCHCTRCQRRTGTSSSAQAQVDGTGFEITQGAELVKAWRPPGGGFEKAFCGECGAQLFSRDPEDHTRMAVRMSAFDGDPGVRPSKRSFVAYAAAWEPIPDDGLPRFDESAQAD